MRDSEPEECARCGDVVRRTRRGTGFCTARCEREQLGADEASRKVEEQFTEDQQGGTP